MGCFCFASYAKILLSGKVQGVTNISLCNKLLGSVGEINSISDASVSHLLGCTQNISPYTIDCVRKADPNVILSYFDKEIVKLINENKRNSVVIALKELILSDSSISGNTRLGKLDDITKDSLAKKDSFIFSVFLTDLFLYAVINVENKLGKSKIKEITKKYAELFESRRNEIILDTSTLVATANIPKTLKGKNFDKVFTEVSHTGKLGLSNPNQLRIFRLSMENNEFSYEDLLSFLKTNIGRYVYSRAKIENFRVSEELESVGLEALSIMNKTGKPDEKGTGNELGEMLLYAFLEQVLGAPKLLSKVELNTLEGNNKSNSDCVHLLTIDGATRYRQLVFGASNIVGDLKNAIDNAFESIVGIEKNKKNELRVVDSTIFYHVFDKDTTDRIKALILPSKLNPDRPDTAFGVFLGYSLGLNEGDLPNSEFKIKAIKKMEEDINYQATYMAKKITDLGMNKYSFYFYVMPFNDAPIDKKEIMCNLMGGVY